MATRPGPAPARSGAVLRLYRRSDGGVLHLHTRLELGAGGEARVYAVPGDEAVVAKVFYHPTRAYARKIAFMLGHAPVLEGEGEVCIAWPLDLLTDERGRFAGLLVSRVDETRRVFEVYNPATRRERVPLFHYGDLHRTGRNLAAAVQALHEGGYVVGDLNESNLLVSPGAAVTMVDTDSFQVTDAARGVVHRCVVGRPEYTPPELQGEVFAEVDRTPEHDRFGLGVLLFHLLMEGTHPFAGSVRTAGDPPPLEARIRAGAFPHARRNPVARPPRTAPPFGILHPGMRELFVRCFEDGHRDPSARPGAAEWRDGLAEAERALTTCGANPQHRFGGHLGACPWCERAAVLRGRDPFPSPSVVAQGVHLAVPPPSRRVASPPPASSLPRAPLSRSRQPFHSLLRPGPLSSVPPRAWGWAGLVMAVLSFGVPTLRVPLAVLAVLSGAVGWERNGSLARAGARQTVIALLLGATMLLAGLLPHEERTDSPDDPYAGETSAPSLLPDLTFEESVPPALPDPSMETPAYPYMAGSEVKPVLLNTAEIRREMAALYPEAMRKSGVIGQTMVKFAIDTDGNVVSSTITVVYATAGGFGQASRKLAERFRFDPTTVGGNGDPVVVRMPITWRVER